MTPVIMVNYWEGEYRIYLTMMNQQLRELVGAAWNPHTNLYFGSLPHPNTIYYDHAQVEQAAAAWAERIGAVRGGTTYIPPGVAAHRYQPME
jgi:hypothetical protein